MTDVHDFEAGTISGAVQALELPLALGGELDIFSETASSPTYSASLTPLQVSPERAFLNAKGIPSFSPRF